MNSGSILSLQLYSLRDLRTLDAQLEAASSAGFQFVEPIQAQLDAPVTTRRKLADHGLSATSAHVAMEALRANLHGMFDAAREIGVATLVMPCLPQAERAGDIAHWRRTGAELGAIAWSAEKAGLQFAYHNHDWELVALDDGRAALLHLFEGAGREPLGWEADIAWIARGGADPEQVLDLLEGRLVAAHVKDLAPEGTKRDEEGWEIAGRGILDWHALWDSCRRHGATLMVAEHDKPRDPTQFARESFLALSGFAA